jgi:hypothetical protein
MEVLGSDDPAEVDEGVDEEFVLEIVGGLVLVEQVGGTARLVDDVKDVGGEVGVEGVFHEEAVM